MVKSSKKFQKIINRHLAVQFRSNLKAIFFSILFSLDKVLVTVGAVLAATLTKSVYQSEDVRNH